MRCSEKLSLSSDLEEGLLTSIGTNRTYIAVFEMRSKKENKQKDLPVFLRFSQYREQLTFIPVVNVRIDLNYFNREKAYYLCNSQGLFRNVTRDRIVSAIKNITFGQGLCVSDKAHPLTYFKISLPEHERCFGTVRKVNHIRCINDARNKALNIIDTMEPIII